MDESSSEEEDELKIIISQKGFPEGYLIFVYDSYKTVSIHDIKSKYKDTMSEMDDLDSFLNDQQEDNKSFLTPNFTQLYNTSNNGH